MVSFLLPKNRAALISRFATSGMSQHADMLPGTPPLTGEAAWDAWRQAAPETERRMVYLHVPFCRSRCSFCGFYSHATTEESIGEYTELLLRELGRTDEHAAFARDKIDVVYFGGGTPTDLSADGLRRLIGFIRDRFAIADDVEFTVEGRLFGFDDEKVEACASAGATRFSFGVQTFATALRRSLGRRLTREEVIERLVRIKAICGERVALIADLIYGLPGQTQADWMEDVRTVHEEVPLDGVDLYRLKLLPGIPLTARLEKERPWAEEELLLRYTEACRFLSEKGWNRLSITHWGRERLERNRYNHWAKTGVDILPYGCGAGGALGDWTFMQTSDIGTYRTQVEAGRKPLAMAMRKPPSHRLKARIVDQMERGFLEPGSFGGIDFTPLLENWTAAGAWAPDGAGMYRLTPLGEFYQTRLTALLSGFCLSRIPGGAP
jgi:oxygen-independent coproporphyrinogen-3 oxidase